MIVGCPRGVLAGRPPPVRKEEAMSKKGGNKTKAPPKAPMANKGPKKR